MIPKKIYTCWFPTEETMPPHIAECVESQRSQCAHGYEFELITLNNLDKSHPYIQQCLTSPHNSKKWVKLKDFVQYYYLYNYGGWFLDADMKILEGKSLDSLQDNDFVIGIEGEGSINESIVIGSAIIGSSINNPILQKTLDIMVSKFRGDDDKCYESSLDILSQLCIDYQDKIRFTEPDVFYPYNHNTNKTNITSETIGIHMFTKSWILPTVSVIIPHLGESPQRVEGLEKVIESIKNSFYPMELIEIMVIKGEETVPQKVARGVAKTKGEYIIYAANDVEFHIGTIRLAIECSIKQDKALVSFNEGYLLPDKGNICGHFVIRRNFLQNIGNEIFSTDFNHVGCDNYLWAQCYKLGQAIWCEEAMIDHNHFSNGAEYDDVYQKGWGNAEKDREILKVKLSKLNDSEDTVTYRNVLNDLYNVYH